VLNSVSHQLCAAFQFELRHDAVFVERDRSCADLQVRRDLLHAFALRQSADNRTLSFREFCVW
jgi:hypothetical protein